MGRVYDAHELKTGAEFLDEDSEEMVFMGIAVTMNDYLSVYEDGYIVCVHLSPRTGQAGEHLRETRNRFRAVGLAAVR
jgi:hypothetical protein